MNGSEAARELIKEYLFEGTPRKPYDSSKSMCCSYLASNGHSEFPLGEFEKIFDEEYDEFRRKTEKERQ
jgi:hypothetical protein